MPKMIQFKYFYKICLAPKRLFNYSFTVTWEQRKLGEIADIIGGGTPSTSNSDYWDGEIDWYAPAEIADQIYVSSSTRKITKKGFMLIICYTRIYRIKTTIFKRISTVNKRFSRVGSRITDTDISKHGIKNSVIFKTRLTIY